MSLAELIIKIKADIAQATAGFAAVNASMTALDKSVMDRSKNIRKTLSGLAKKFILVGTVATVALALGIAKATATFAKFEQSITNAASVTGAMGEEFDRIKAHVGELAKELGETTVFSAVQAADAMYDLASAGYDVGSMVASDLVPILDLAAATQADLKFTTETVTSTLAQFGMEINQSSRVADVFAMTIGSSKATMDKLSTSMSYAGPIAKALGISLETTSASLGILYNAGLDASQGGTALRAMMQRLMLPTGGAKRALEEMSLTVADVDVTSRSFADILDTLKGRNMSAAQAVEIFGVRAASAALGLVANVDQLRELDGALQNAGGTAEIVAKEQLDTLKGAFTLLKSKLEGLLISVGEVVNVGLRGFLSEINNLFPAIKEFAVNGVQNLIDLLNELGPTWESIKSITVSMVGIVSDLGEAFGFAGKEGISKLAEMTNKAATSLAGIFAWIDKHPVVTKLAVVILGVAAAFAYVLPAVMAVIGAVSSLIGFVSALAGAVGGATTIIGGLSAVIAVLGGPITVAIGLIALLAGAWATNLFGIRDVTKNVLGWVENKFIDFVNFLGPILATIVNLHIKVFNKIIDALNFAGADLDHITELQFTKLENKVKETEDVVSSSTDAMEGDIDKSIDGISSSLDSGTESFDNFADSASTSVESVQASMNDLKGLSEMQQKFVQRGGFVTGSGEYIGRGHKDWEALSAKDIGPTPDLITQAGVAGTTGVIETTHSREILEEQKVVNTNLEILDELKHLSTLETISTKLDKLKLEINNYVTNNYNKNSSRSGRTGTIGVVDQHNDSKAADSNVAKGFRDYSNPLKF